MSLEWLITGDKTDKTVNLFKCYRLDLKNKKYSK